MGSESACPPRLDAPCFGAAAPRGVNASRCEMRVERLKRARDFGAAVSRGRTFTNRFFVVFVYDAPGEPARVGFAAARAAGTIVKRNRIRRRLRAAVAEMDRRLRPDRRIVVLGKTSVLDAEWGDVTRGLEALLDRAQCLEG